MYYNTASSFLSISNYMPHKKMNNIQDNRF